MCIPTNRKKTITHIKQGRQNYSLQVEKFCTDGRTWSYSRYKLPKRCRCSIPDWLKPTHGGTDRKRIWSICQYFLNQFPRHLLQTFQRDPRTRSRGFGYLMFSDLSAQNKTAPETMRSLQRFFPPESKPRVIYTDHFLGVPKKHAKICRGSMTNLLHIDPKQMESPKERSDEQKKKLRLCYDSLIRMRRTMVLGNLPWANNTLRSTDILSSNFQKVQKQASSNQVKSPQLYF